MVSVSAVPRTVSGIQYMVISDSWIRTCSVFSYHWPFEHAGPSAIFFPQLTPLALSFSDPKPLQGAFSDSQAHAGPCPIIATPLFPEPWTFTLALTRPMFFSLSPLESKLSEGRDCALLFTSVARELSTELGTQ